jgi:ethylmalonyl-CoA mutase
VVGGIIPAADAEALLVEAGVARVYTPRDFDLNRIMGEIADLLATGNGATEGVETAEAGSAA